MDGTRAFHPVAGLLVSGGNPVIGTANTLGGLGRFSLTARANAADIVLPDPEYDGSPARCPPAKSSTRRCRWSRARPGSTKGFPRDCLSIDFLGSAQLLPTNQIDNLTVDADARRIGDVALGFGYGLRVGILRDDGPLPGRVGERHAAEHPSNRLR